MDQEEKLRESLKDVVEIALLAINMEAVRVSWVPLANRLGARAERITDPNKGSVLLQEDLGDLKQLHDALAHATQHLGTIVEKLLVDRETACPHRKPF